MERRFAALPNHVPLTPGVLGTRLPQRTGVAEVKQPGPTLEVKGGVVVFQGTRRDLTNLDDVWELLEAVKRVEGMTQSPPAPLHLRLDGAQDVQAILPMLCRVAGTRKLDLLVEDPDVPQARYSPPPPAGQPAGVHQQA
jgi:hypothetical protein